MKIAYDNDQMPNQRRSSDDSFSSSSYRYSGNSSISATRPSARSSSGSSRIGVGATSGAAETSSHSSTSSSYVPRSSSQSSYYRQPYTSPAANRIGSATASNTMTTSSIGIGMSSSKTLPSPSVASRYGKTSSTSSYSSAYQPTASRDALSRITPSSGLANGASSSTPIGGSSIGVTISNSNPLSASPTPDQQQKISRLARNSYRSVNVSQYAQQAREREERETKFREQVEWEEKEKFREQSEGLNTPTVGSFVSDYRSRTNFASPSVNEFTRSLHTYDPNYFTSSSSANSSAISSNAAQSSRALPTSYATAVSTRRESQPIDIGGGPRGGAAGLSSSPSAMNLSNHLQITNNSMMTRSVHHPAGAQGIPPAPPPPPEGARIPIQHSASAYTVSSYKPYSRNCDEQAELGSVPLGFTGLRNIGNTCFMNATLQMLVNNIELKTYFLERHYASDINVENPLGFKGRLAEAFADFMREMWNQRNRAIEPAKIKELVAEKASQFANFAQHDAHEFLSFLLDGLHEDLNRIKRKPQTGIVESDGRSDFEVADEAWRNHTLRNDSIFVDLFYGQLKSRLQCPSCDRVSITFDPFVYLPVPFPKVKKSSIVYFWPLDPFEKPIKMTVFYPADGDIQDLITALSEMVRVPSRQIRLVETLSHRFQKFFEANDSANDISSGDTLFAFQIHDPTKCGDDEIIELKVLQRQLYLSTSKYSCNHCGSSRELRLKACEGCYNAYYCNKDCQLSDWNTGGHREECGRRTTADPVGQPFIISFLKSQLTWHQLYKALLARSKFSVEIDLPPSFTPSGSQSDLSRSQTYNEPTSQADPLPPPRRAKKGIGAPPSFLNPGPNMPPAKINGVTSDSSVRSASRSPARKSPSRETSTASNRDSTPTQNKQMFLIKKIKEQTVVLGDTISEKENEGLINLETGSWLSINWHNLRNGKPYITVINRRQLDVDAEKSSKFAGRVSEGHASGSTAEPTLQEMLGLFSETEKLKPEEAWYCNRCKQHVEATKKLELYRLPPVLIVQLKRFVYTASAYQTSMHRRSKDERRVVYPVYELDMAPYLAETAPGDQAAKYDLTGVICHSGSSFFGHYVSIGRLAGFDGSKTTADWRLFDDSMVSKTSVSNAQSDDAYLLFYKQRGLATRRIFTKHYSCDPTELMKPDALVIDANPVHPLKEHSLVSHTHNDAILVNGAMREDTNGNPVIKIDKELSPDPMSRS